MKMIVAADRRWGIGKSGNLLIHIPGDMEFFKKQTMGKVVVMGRKTFESLPGKVGLPGRTNIVLTSNPNWQGQGAIPVHSKEELDRILGQYTEDSIYIIGGGQVYQEYLDRCDIIYVTHIEGDFEADTWFPNLDQDERFVQGQTFLEREWQGIVYRIQEWRRK